MKSDELVEYRFSYIHKIKPENSMKNMDILVAEKWTQTKTVRIYGCAKRLKKKNEHFTEDKKLPNKTGEIFSLPALHGQLADFQTGEGISFYPLGTA